MPRAKRTERGWPGHFIGARECIFRRNTLVTYEDKSIVVSTVGNMMFKGRIHPTGASCYYETMAFHSDPNDDQYHDADVSRQVDFDSSWAIYEKEKDNEANDMHDKVVREIMRKLERGEIT